jgi:hypothetical protein
MTYSQEVKTTLRCDLCTRSMRWHGHLSRASAERLARSEEGWRKDKLGRNVCDEHPKLKGAR